MPGQGESSGGRGRAGREARPLALLLAAVWLVLLLALGAGAVQIAAASPSATNPLDCTAGTPTPCPTNTPTLVPTDTPAQATPTTAAAATATPSAAATDTPIATATDAGSGGQSGGVDTSGNQSGGAQPTKVVLAQPTVGSGGDGGLQGLTPAAFSSNGLLIATSLSCVVAILGLIVAVVAISVLVRGGYGPFLKVLVLGKRAARFGKGQGADAASGAGWDGSGSWDRSGAYEYDYDASARYPAPPARTPPRNGNAGYAGNGGNGNGRNSGPRSGPRSGPAQRQAATRTRNLRER